MAGKKYKTGIVLSGGGARGIAHIGILKALNEANIYPDVISATSAGAVVGVLYAAGHSPDQIFDHFKNEHLMRKLRLHVSSKGLFHNNKMLELLPKYLKEKTFEELKIPLHICVADLFSGKLFAHSSGDLYMPLKATTAVPILFQAIKHEDKLLIDGGSINNLPIEPIKKDCEKIIGVSVNPVPPLKKINGMTEMVERVVTMVLWENIRYRIKECDLFIEPKELGYISATDLGKQQELFDIAYDHTRGLLSEIDVEEYRV